MEKVTGFLLCLAARVLAYFTPAQVAGQCDRAGGS
jgi:hypothetical protein